MLRHADDITLNHLIELRKLESQNQKFREALETISTTESIADLNPSVDTKMMWIAITYIVSLCIIKINTSIFICGLNGFC